MQVGMVGLGRMGRNMPRKTAFFTAVPPGPGIL